MSAIIKTTIEQQIQLASTAVNISDVVHNDQKKYSALYDRIGDAVGGFPAIYHIIARYAIALEDSDYDDELLIKLCDMIGAKILRLSVKEALADAESVSDLKPKIKAIIRKARKEEGWNKD